MNQSLILRQQVDHLQDTNSLTNVNKAIRKQRQTRRTRQKQKQVCCVVLMPRILREEYYVKSAVDLKLALKLQEATRLGGLNESPCTYHYRVCRTDQVGDVYYFNLEPLEKDNVELEQVVRMLQNSEDPSAQTAIDCVRKRYQQHQEIQKLEPVLELELLEIEKMAKNYPYQVNLERINRQSSSYLQRIVNEQFNRLMGVSKEMLFHHMRETDSLPSIFYLGDSLQTWCELTKMSLQHSRHFQAEINSYEGARYMCDIEQSQMIKRASNDSLIYIEFWIVKPDDRLKKVLLDDQRIYKNHLDYFNRKNTQEEYQRFRGQMYQKRQILYGCTEPCGFRQIVQ